MILEKKTLCVLVLYDSIGIANNIYVHAAICFSSFPKMVWPDGDPIITVYFKHIQGTLVAWRVQVHESGWEDWEEVRLDKIMLRNCCCVFHHKTCTCKGLFPCPGPHLPPHGFVDRCFVRSKVLQCMIFCMCCHVVLHAGEW